MKTRQLPTVAPRLRDASIQGTLDYLDEPKFHDLARANSETFGVAATAIVAPETDGSLRMYGGWGFGRAQTDIDAGLWEAITGADELTVFEDLADDPRFGRALDFAGIAIRFLVVRPLVVRGLGVFAHLVFADESPRAPGPDQFRHLEMLAGEVERIATQSRELDQAGEVQRALHPRSFLVPPEFDLAGMCVPSREVGGDFFDWYPADGGFALTVADVMGKGIGAAILAAAVRATIRSAADESALAAVSRAGATLADDFESSRSFVTVFHARVDTASAEIDFVDAGHGLAFIIRSDGAVESLASEDVPLGMAVGWSWRSHRTALAPGETLVVLSDGVLDLDDGSLAAIDRAAAVVSAASSAQAAVDEFARRASGTDAPDDVTVVVLRRIGTEARGV